MKTIFFLDNVSPKVDGHGVPWCSSDKCVHYDGKRCRATGLSPGSICEPAVQQMAEVIASKVLP